MKHYYFGMDLGEIQSIMDAFFEGKDVYLCDLDSVYTFVNDVYCVA